MAYVGGEEEAGGRWRYCRPLGRLLCGAGVAVVVASPGAANGSRLLGANGSRAFVLELLMRKAARGRFRGGNGSCSQNVAIVLEN